MKDLTLFSDFTPVKMLNHLLAIKNGDTGLLIAEMDADSSQHLSFTAVKKNRQENGCLKSS